LYLPGMPSALAGIEWWIFLGWTVLGIVLYSYATAKQPGKSKAFMDAEIEALKKHNIEWLKENNLM